MEEIKIHRISQEFIFCEGHIGNSDFSPYLSQLPKINLVYASLPKPEYLPFWNNLVGRKKQDQLEFIQGLERILKTVDADEYHLEVNAGNKQEIVDVFENWGAFAHYTEMVIYYSAPLDGRTKGMAKKRIPDQMIVFSKYPIELPNVKYSHEYVEHITKRAKKIVCFDPVIGKGLLARCAIKNGHSCYGIDMNSQRLECTYEYLHRAIETATFD